MRAGNTGSHMNPVLTVAVFIVLSRCTSSERRMAHVQSSALTGLIPLIRLADKSAQSTLFKAIDSRPETGAAVLVVQDGRVVHRKDMGWLISREFAHHPEHCL